MKASPKNASTLVPFVLFFLFVLFLFCFSFLFSFLFLYIYITNISYIVLITLYNRLIIVEGLVYVVYPCVFCCVYSWTRVGGRRSLLFQIGYIRGGRCVNVYVCVCLSVCFSPLLLLLRLQLQCI